MRAITRGRANLGGRLSSQSLAGCQWVRVNVMQLAALHSRGDVCIKQGTSHAVTVQLAVLGERFMAHSCSPTGPLACKGTPRESWGCVPQNVCSPQLHACKNIAPVRVSDPYFSSSKTLQRCSISSSPSP